MTEQEFSYFTAALKTYYPREGLFPNKQSMELWYKQLQDLDFKVAETALNKWVATNKWSPSIADIRQQAAEVANGELPDWSEGWKNLLSCISKYGMYRPAEAMESLDPITRRCVERLGYNYICMSDNITADRANFRMMYEAEAEREKHRQQLPELVQKQIAQIRQEHNGMIEDKGGHDGSI